MTQAVFPQNETTSHHDIHSLNGRVVLVRSARDHRNPPAGIRGWIEVQERPDGAPEVRIAVEFPQMFSTAAHHRTFTLSQEAVERLMASDQNGTFEYTIDDELI
jgi:hypothetical protein